MGRKLRARQGPGRRAIQGRVCTSQKYEDKDHSQRPVPRGGQYSIPNLPAGDYELRIRAVGYQAQPHTGVSLTADQTASFDFVLQKGKVHWTDLSLYQADQLLPAGKGKGALFTPQPGQPTATCAACHGIQTRIASTVRDEAGWRDRVEYMRTTMRVRISDQEAGGYRFVSE